MGLSPLSLLKVISIAAGSAGPEAEAGKQIRVCRGCRCTCIIRASLSQDEYVNLSHSLLDYRRRELPPP